MPDRRYNSDIDDSGQMTLKELAGILNLAPSTVSKALKGHADISKATRERVREAAKQLQYRPSAMASGLRNKKFRLIAVIVPALTDYFYASALQGIIEYAGEKEYKVLIFDSQEQYEKEADICFSLQKSGIDGVLLSPARTTLSSTHIEELRAEIFPLVFFGRMLGDVQVDRVIEDDYYGACRAVNYLIESGCRKIAHLAAPQHWVWAQKRQMGYIQALLDHHMKVDRELIVEFQQDDEIIELLIRKYGVDGIFTVDDSSAVRALFVLHRLGLEVPRDVSVCGYGNEPVTWGCCPSLTTVERNGKSIGKNAAELLIRRIERKIGTGAETKLLKSELIIRDSTLPLILKE